VLTIFGKSHSRGGFCDGVSRRDFLTIGGTLLGGLTLPRVLEAETSTRQFSHKSVINIYLPGGPPHQDMWDLKPDAPAEIRGEFKPIRTNVPGIEICELFPKIASMMDKFIPIRTIVGASGDHDAWQCMTGWPRKDTSAAGGRPSMGAWVSRLAGPVNKSCPQHMSLMYQTGERRWGDPGDGGFLGLAHAPFRVTGGARGRDGRPSENLKHESMVLQGITLERLQDRRGLLSSLDGFRREADASGGMEGMDAFHEQAVGILTSSKLADALDLSKEDPKVVERYGVNDPAFERDGAPRMVRNFCVARRLVEAGARVVSMNFTRWDWHGPDGKNFVQARKDFPLLDRALSSLVQDLCSRGLDRDVSVVVWGEFGRTPKINKEAGRDHWPQVSCAMLAGGGMRTGQVIGATNKYAEHAVSRPVTFQEVFATLYHNMGLDVGQVRQFDARGRPQYLVDEGVQPIREVI
jgi:hypothetical protein